MRRTGRVSRPRCLAVAWGAGSSRDAGKTPSRRRLQRSGAAARRSSPRCRTAWEAEARTTRSASRSVRGAYPTSPARPAFGGGAVWPPLQLLDGLAEPGHLLAEAPQIPFELPQQLAVPGPLPLDSPIQLLDDDLRALH